MRRRHATLLVLASLRGTLAWILPASRLSSVRRTRPTFRASVEDSTDADEAPTPTACFDVTVTDNVFSSEVCTELEELAFDHAQRGQDGSSVFDRRRDRHRWTPIEHALHSYLTRIDDPNPVVEYWSRNEYLNMDAHADIDEQELEDDGTLRYPEWAHVLYMDIEDGVRGPTCVLDRYGGWDSQDSVSNGDNPEAVTLITVPAVQGRVLRFPGSAMHAVPKPCCRWLLSRDQERALRAEEKKRLEEERNAGDLVSDNGVDTEPFTILQGDDEYIEIADDDEDRDLGEDSDDEDWEERSVLLFNTWADNGPRGVSEDYITGILPQGISVIDDGDGDETGPPAVPTEKDRIDQQLKEWREEYGPACEEVYCNEPTEWRSVPIADAAESSCNDDDDDATTVRISLMGARNRRLHFRRYVELETDGDIRDALNDDLQPSRILLWP